MTHRSRPPRCGAAGDPRLHLPFAEATITDPPPADQQLPETTLTGKSVGKLYVEVERHWNEIRFVSASSVGIRDQVSKKWCW